MQWLLSVLMVAILGQTCAYTEKKAGLLKIPRRLNSTIKELILDKNNITAIANELENYSHLQVSHLSILIMERVSK